MRIVVVYESMYGNTHLIADAIADGFRGAADADVTVVAVGDADAALVGGADLLVVGGPTHVHGMSRESTRKAAVEAAEKPGADLVVDPDAAGAGLREWIESLGRIERHAAAFDTRFDMPPLITGRGVEGDRGQAARARLQRDRDRELLRREEQSPRAARGEAGAGVGPRAPRQAARVS